MPPGSDGECRRFCVGVLGMHELEKPPPMAATGGLWARAGRVEPYPGVEEGFRPAREAHPGLLASNLGRFPGYRRFYVHDNAGDRLGSLTLSEGQR